MRDYANDDRRLRGYKLVAKVQMFSASVVHILSSTETMFLLSLVNNGSLFFDSEMRKSSGLIFHRNKIIFDSGTTMTSLHLG